MYFQQRHRSEEINLDGTGDDFIISTLHEGLTSSRMHPGTGVCKPPNHEVLTEDRAQATHFEAVETLRQGPREYYTLPDYVYFRLKGTQSFLKVHAWEQIGVLPPDAVTNGRRHRTNEGHAFMIYPDPRGVCRLVAPDFEASKSPRPRTAVASSPLFLSSFSRRLVAATVGCRFRRGLAPRRGGRRRGERAGRRRRG